MAIKSLCGVLNLSASLVILACCILAIAFVIVMSIVPYRKFPKCLVFIILFALLMAVTACVMVAAVYHSSRKLTLVSLVLVCVMIVLFVVGSVMSFTNQKSLVEFVCVEERCPETFWCVSLKYRQYEGLNSTIIHPVDYYPYDDDQGYTSPKNNDTIIVVVGDATTTTTTTTTDYADDYYYQDSEITGYVIGVAFAFAVVLFVVNLIFLGFTAFIVFSFLQEVKRIERSSEKRPSVEVGVQQEPDDT